ncbi:MAG: hypothetical protein PW845_22950 [Pseudomonas sp.]|uniref:hypothetical protein n=1 Tax=Pseudomonas abieticivorans TaxID=2931382 RepID=UPI0020C10C0B|nr:hypothetical protein [Pseudomonas sp. PIA16]MDE1168156.1 hypothetical protein [Pseudomonas sp.]
MSTQEKMTGDLFEVDKRLSLKPVVDFNNYLREAFGTGKCTCVRCTTSAWDETGYEFQHTFDIGGQALNRRFALTAGSDVLLALKKAWLSYTKAELSNGAILDLDAIKGFVEPGLHNRLVPLVLASGLAKDIDGKLHVQPQAA